MKLNQYILLSLLWFIASIYALLIREPGKTPPPFLHFDKVAHFGLFFGQAWLLAKIWLKNNQPIPIVKLTATLVIWAAMSEILQGLLTTNRQADVFDFFADVVGLSCALWLAYQVNKNDKRNESKNKYSS